MAKNFLELIIGSLDDKKRWRAYRARVKALPAPYRDSAEAVERYLMNSGGIPNDGARLVGMFSDLADLFEQAAADGTPDDQAAPLMDNVIRPLFAAYGLLKAARARRQPLDLDLPERRIDLADGAGRRVSGPITAASTCWSSTSSWPVTTRRPDSALTSMPVTPEISPTSSRTEAAQCSHVMPSTW